MIPETKLPERNKKAGVFYAVTDDGIELPIIDVTHPAFALSLSPVEMRGMTERFVERQDRFQRIPAWLGTPLMRFALNRSRIGRGLASASGTFLDGLSTYLIKLGPENLGEAYARRMDRDIAASLPGVAMRLRLQDVSGLLADGLIGPLSAERCNYPPDPRPGWRGGAAQGPRRLSKTSGPRRVDGGAGRGGRDERPGSPRQGRGFPLIEP